MKKIILNTIFLVTLGVGMAGCLKDKGFENNEYGINDPDDSPEGVGFPWATSTDPRILSVASVTTPQVVDGPTVVFFSGEKTTRDIHVNLVANQALVTAWNADPDNDPLATFPNGAYNIPSLKVTIPAGTNMGMLKINVPTTNGLDFSSVYGLGFTIASVDEPGYIIAENMKNLIIGINVKNQWDAEYTTSGYFFHPSSPRALNDHKRLATVSAIGLRAPLADLYTQDYYFDFEIAANNALTNFVPRGATPPGSGSGFFNQDVPNPGGLNPYPSAGDQKPGQGEWLHSRYNNTYDPATKTFWMHYGYNGAAQSWTRQAYEKWVRD